MKIKCDYCGNTYEDTLEKCPSCGAPNPSHQNEGKPKTIEDLKKWYKDRNLPAPEVTRFFIGEDYKEPKAFGIYRNEDGEYIVYKNKADGSRAIRYQGKDEQYAVNELYQKLKDEIVHQKNSSSGSTRTNSKKKSVFKYLYEGFLILFCVLFISTFISDFVKGRHNGYYGYNGQTYYSYNDDWYYFSDDDWHEVPYNDPAPQTISSNYDDYYMSKEWNSSIDATDWDESSYYNEHHSSDSDSDYDWGGNDSWDSDSTDWGSDW